MGAGGHGRARYVCERVQYRRGPRLDGVRVRLLVPVPYVVLIVAITVGMLALEVRVPYRSYSKVLRWLTLSLLAYVAMLFVIDVDWADVLRHTLIPSMTWDRVHVAALIAILGTTISPYLFFWQTSEEVEELGESGAEGGHSRLIADTSDT